MPEQVDEGEFRRWYAEQSRRYGLNTNPDADDQFYDYRGAFRAGAKPDASGHWPSQFKRAGHPNEVVGGFNTRTGERVAGTKQASEQELVSLGWDAATAKRLSAMPQTQTYRVTDPTTGKTVRLTGDGPPTAAELDEIFANINPAPAKDEAPPKPSRGVLGQVSDAAVGLWEKQPIHPIDMVTGAVEAVKHPIDTASGILQAQQVPFDRAKASFGKGDYAAGVMDVFNWMIPILGPQVSDLQERYRRGEASAGGVVGESLGIGLQASLPEAARRLPTTVKVAPKVTNKNPAEVEAVKFGQAQGIPIDAATATGNPVVRGAQALADRSLGGAAVGPAARAQQEAGLTRVSGELAGRAHPKPVTPYQAGEAVQAGLETRLKEYGAEANQAYEALRTIEADPKLTRQVQIKVDMKDAAGNVKKQTVTVPMQMPVDLRVVKAQLRPLSEQMRRQMPVTQQRADPALHAIDNILSSPDFLPASMVDMDLSAIKSLSRTDAPTRNMSQGLAATAVKTLEAEVQKAVAQGGKPATDALLAGRNATKAKYGVADIMKGIREEPRQAFDQAIWANDAGIDKLTAMAKETPSAMPQIGRAYLDDLFAGATAEGGFGKTASLHAKWQKLGPKTKELLFKDPSLRRDLDNFFLLAKKTAENPNPSGSGYTASLTLQGAYILTEPVTGIQMAIGGYALSKLLHSPAGVRALTQGLRVPIGNKAASASAVGSIVKAAEAQGVRLMPATAQDQSERR